MMSIRKAFVGIVIVIIGLSWSVAAQADHVDVYLIYSADVRVLRNDMKKTLAPDYMVKSYNVDLLAVADYSGRQKILAKLVNAQLIVLIGQKPVDLLGHEGLENVVSVSNNAGKTVAVAKVMHWLNAMGHRH